MVNSFTVKKTKLVGIIILGLAFLIGLIFFVIGYFKPKVAGIFIETDPPANVFIDGEEVGRTPYEVNRSPGELVIKLIPDSFQAPLTPYETKVNLIAGVQTVIRRVFADSEEGSAGEIISFERIAKEETSLTVVSIPDSAQLEIDGRDKAFTPHKTSSILPGGHTLVLSSEGFQERIIEVKTHQGYKLTAIVKLAKSQGQEVIETLSVTPTPSDIGKEMVEILETSTGFLRVRREPSTLGEEIGRVEPGEKYPLIQTDEKTGWFEIEYEEGKEGWISNQYARKIEGGSKLTPTPSKKVTQTPSPKVTPSPN